MTVDQDIAEIKARNKKVEIDKEWETSHTRKICILVITYALATIVMIFIGVSNPFFHAVIPTLGFFLSTLSLSFIKKYWIKHHYTK